MPQAPRRLVSDPEWPFVRWAALHGGAVQGFWLVTSVFIVVDVGLSPLELLLLGTVLEVTILVAEVPTGVMADTVSRKWSMVVSMLIMGAGFILAGRSGSFAPLALANVAWGIGFTFTSGADIAWISDELAHNGADQRAVDTAVSAAARWRQRGGAAGLLVFGLLGWLTTPALAMIAAGLVLVALAGWIALLFGERGFSPVPQDRLARSRAVFRVGLAVVTADRVLLNLLLVTLLFNLGAEAVDRLTEARLIGLGLPYSVSPVLFFTGLGIAGLAGGASLLRLVDRWLIGDDGPRLIYGTTALVAAVGALLVAGAPIASIGALGVFLARGLAWSVLPVVGSVWLNRSTGSEARATVQSFLGQATSAGQILGGLVLGLTATVANIPAALIVSAVLFAAGGLLILGRSSGDRSAPT